MNRNCILKCNLKDICPKGILMRMVISSSYILMILSVLDIFTMRMILYLILTLIISTVISVNLFITSKYNPIHSDSSIIGIIKVWKDILGLLILSVKRKSVFRSHSLCLKLIQSWSCTCLSSTAAISIKKCRSSSTSNLTTKTLSRFQDSITMMMISVKTCSKSRTRKESISKTSFLALKTKVVIWMKRTVTRMKY
jgi:hypothetical protein